ncbi:MGDG synthase family glycosyltransferase [Pelosinus propionicus]|uniref:UDP-N-acetylglucosamine:LPS N-acetylglucosamine transferase n=1 Tax=Pelosinus propionicus DSM 13327 TaxID=1123291 RepID=A0A1I4HJL5_9FIRM|nr:glycosyltransferase [Pelosinus propionicus]SFL42314.1 UDP-N-acetylglucosamine:LPS N-acetylglucosamine transferase [Pelosinus propionicus DSM 13327]
MANKPTKIMFAISDTGGGHRSAAASIIAALDQELSIQSTIVDFLRTTNFPGLKKAPEIYDYCSKNHVWLNNLFFNKTNSINRIKALTKIVYLQSRYSIKHAIEDSSPDAVVAVHPLVIGLLHQTRKASHGTWPIIAVVTDLVTIHASWATPGADLYLVPTQDAFRSLIQYGIPYSQIIYTGFPVHPKFKDFSLSKEQACDELGIKSDAFTVLFTGGGVGAGNMRDWVHTLKAQCPDKQLLVITGNNKELYNKLKKSNAHCDGLHVYGFVDNMEKLMAASDVIVSKAGPGTLMEGVAMKKTLIVTEAVGIQETGNIDFIINNQLGYHCPTPKEACKRINQIANSTSFGKLTCKEIADANGSKYIADIILDTTSAAIAANISKKSHEKQIFIGA